LPVGRLLLLFLLRKPVRGRTWAEGSKSSRRGRARARQNGSRQSSAYARFLERILRSIRDICSLHGLQYFCQLDGRMARPKLSCCHRCRSSRKNREKRDYSESSQISGRRAQGERWNEKYEKSSTGCGGS